MRSFSHFSGQGGAKDFAEQLAKDLSQGSQVPSLSAAEARSALSIRDALDAFRHQTGRSVTAIQAVTDYLSAARKLGDRPLAEAVEGFLGTVATIKRVKLAVAVEEFIAGQGIKTKAKEGERAQLSSGYVYQTSQWLRNFAADFPGYDLCDFGRDHLKLYFCDKRRTDLAPKSRNHLRATVKMFFNWAVRNDYLPTNHRLLEADVMRRETLTGGETDFYRPAELRALLENADEIMLPILAIQALAGVRLEEAHRLEWQDVFGTEGHIVISATKSKTRSRRLVSLCPALAAWLKPFQAKEGRLWTAHRDTWHSRFNDLRESLHIPARKNGLRHGFCTFHFALHGNENLTAAQAGNSPTMIHQSYKGLATKKQAEEWFSVQPVKAGDNIIELPQQSGAMA